MIELEHKTPIADAIAEFDPRGSRSGEASVVVNPDAQPGSTFPDPTLLGVDGEPTTLSAIRNGKPAVVVLYRGAWCPYCNTALRVYRNELAPALRERNIELVAVSPQHPDGSLTMQEKHDLDFSVLSDPGNQIARTLGVLTHPAEAARRMSENGLDLAEVNADGTIDLPMPTVALVDATGVLRWIDVHADHTVRTEPAQILRVIEELGL